MMGFSCREVNIRLLLLPYPGYLSFPGGKHERQGPEGGVFAGGSSKDFISQK